MKTSDAIKILEQVCPQLTLNRDGHIQVQMALEVLKKATEEPKKKK